MAQRRLAGITWYPIAIRGSEPARGDYLTVELERTTHPDVSHQFRFGSAAVLFSNHNPRHDRVEGTVVYQGNNRLKITLRVEELPDWADEGKLGVELLFDNNSYDEMQKALKVAAKRSENSKENHLISILTGFASPSFHQNHPLKIIPQLNSSQQEAVNKILSARDLAVVHGPPGTGKTTTLVQAVKALVEQDAKQILVVAPSNTAVDLLTERLSEEGLDVLRVGNPVRVSENLMSLTLDGKMSNHSSIKEVRKLKKQAAEFMNMAHKYKRNFGRAEREQRKALFNEAHKIIKEASNTEQFIIDDLIAKAQVITATLVGANHHIVQNITYHTVVIDEAGQALEPACWIPILKAQKVVLAGDPFQLPPTMKSDEAARKGMATTLLERCIQNHPESVVLLEEQYRMNSAIMAYSSKVFYGDKLRAHSSVANRNLDQDDTPVVFLDTAGCGFDEKLEGTSTTNPEEASLLINHLELTLSPFMSAAALAEFPLVAVISPYKEQVRVIRDLLQENTILQPYAAYISINTIDSFQGQERDVVYISMTRTNAEGSIGFLSDIRRMNVAMTRAKRKLVVVGDSATLSRLTFYADFIAYTEKQGGYRSAWEFM